MTIKEMISQLGLTLVAGGLERKATGGYVGDLLSFVMAHAKEGDVWITVQGHLTSLAVAVMVGISAIILAENVKPDEEVIERSNKEQIPLLISSKNSFELANSLKQCLKQ